MTGQAQEQRPRRRTWWIVAALLAVALVAGVVVWRLHTDRGVRVGDHFDGLFVSQGQTKDQHLTVPLPVGSLNVTVSTAREVDEQDHAVHAPSGAKLLSVSWTPTAAVDAPVWPQAGPSERRDPGADLMVVTGGHRYRVATAVTAADASASTVIVVRGDGSDAHVETRFAGRTLAATTGEQPGRTAKTESTRACEDPSRQTFSGVSCSLPVYRAVYVAGLGAAPAGKEWLLVSGANATRDRGLVHAYGDGDKFAAYAPSGSPKVTVTVAGTHAKPRMAGKDQVTGGAVVLAARAWLVDADSPSKVTFRYRMPTKLDRAVSEWPDAPATQEVDVSTTTTYPGV